MNELLVAVNPDPDSRLPYLLRLPLGDGMVFRHRASGTRPRRRGSRRFRYHFRPAGPAADVSQCSGGPRASSVHGDALRSSIAISMRSTYPGCAVACCAA